MQRATTTNMAAALLASSVVRPTSVQKFKLKMRLVCSDRYAAQLASERGIARHRKWAKLCIMCEVHKSTGSGRYGMQLLRRGTRGTFYVSHSLRFGGNFRIFRRALYLEIYDTISIREGVPSQEDTDYIRVVLTISGGTEKQRALLQVLSQFLPNGNWLRDDVVEVIIPPGTVWSRRACMYIIVIAQGYKNVGRHGFQA